MQPQGPQERPTGLDFTDSARKEGNLRDVARVDYGTLVDQQQRVGRNLRIVGHQIPRIDPGLGVYGAQWAKYQKAAGNNMRRFGVVNPAVQARTQNAQAGIDRYGQRIGQLEGQRDYNQFAQYEIDAHMAEGRREERMGGITITDTSSAVIGDGEVSDAPKPGPTGAPKTPRVAPEPMLAATPQRPGEVGPGSLGVLERGESGENMDEAQARVAMERVMSAVKPEVEQLKGILEGSFDARGKELLQRSIAPILSGFGVAEAQGLQPLNAAEQRELQDRMRGLMQKIQPLVERMVSKIEAEFQKPENAALLQAFQARGGQGLEGLMRAAPGGQGVERPRWEPTAKALEGLSDEQKAQVQERLAALPNDVARGKAIVYLEKFQTLEEKQAVLRIADTLARNEGIVAFLNAVPEAIQNISEPEKWVVPLEHQAKVAEVSSFLQSLSPVEQDVLKRIDLLRAEVNQEFLRREDLQRTPGVGTEGAVDQRTPEEIQKGAQEELKGINADLAAGKEIKESDKMIAMGRVMMSQGVTVSERGNQLVADAPPTGENAGMERGLIKFMGIIMLIGGYIQKFKEAKEGSKGEKTEGAGEGKEEVDPVQARVDNLNNHPGNTFAKFSIESRDEVKDGGIHEKHKDLRIAPKAGSVLNLDQATLDSMKLIAGADVTDPNSILIKDITEAKLTEIEGHLKSVLNSSVLNKMRGKQGNTEDSLRGVEKALDQQGVWVQGEGDKSTYKYIVKGGSIVAYNTDTRAWHLLNKNSGQFERQQPGKYFNVQTGQFDALPRGKKYNTETNTLEDKNVEDLKKDGVDFITKKHKGILEGDKYVVDIPWDMDDLYVHFNEGTSKWEVKEQDEATYHVPGDGGMPDEWSGDGLKKVTAIVEGLRKLNAGEESSAT